MNVRKLHQKLSAWKNTAIGKLLLQNQRGYQSQSKLLNSNPSMNKCESLNLFGSGILMTFKLSLSDLGNSDSFDNCYLPGKKVYTSIWEFPQFVVQEGSFEFLAGNCADYFSTELCSLNSNFKRSLKFNEYFRKVHMLFNNKSIIKLLGLVACIS